MAKVRQEDAEMKIPALLHLSRLGYGYLSPRETDWDVGTNICPNLLRAALARLHGAELADDLFDRLMSDLRERLNRPDQGEAFYRTLRDGWNGLPLIDYQDPERNEFTAVPEMSCRAGRRSFRPDITLLVNGLPLAMIEVKTDRQEHGIRAEYDRMRDRFANSDFRRFLQAAQVWAFSDNRPQDADRLLPTEGVCFAAPAAGDFPLRVFPEQGWMAGRRLPPVPPEIRERIWADLGDGIKEKDKEFRRALAPETPTHRMLTALFAPDRFLFLLRYGMQYGLETGAMEEQARRKNLVTAEQLSALWTARGKLRRGFRNWSIVSPGAAGEGAMTVSLMTLLREGIPGCRIYWVAANRAELLRMDAELKRWGMETTRRGRLEPGMPVLMEPGENPETWLREAGERDFPGRRVFLLPSPFPGSERMQNFRRRLRSADPEAILIRFTRSAEPETGGNFTYLLECADGSLYCGWTNDLDRRVQAHNEGRGAKYTRSRGPVKLVYYEKFATREEAMSREWHLKRLTRRQKERLIAESSTEEEKKENGRNEA